MSKTLAKNKKRTYTAVLEENNLIHEHEFVTVRLAGDTNYYYIIQCLTCGQYFCQICGKALSPLSDKPMSINLKSC